MEAKVNQDLCVGCRMCTETCPSCFEMDEKENKARAKKGCDPEKEKCFAQAKENCPVNAIGTK